MALNDVLAGVLGVEDVTAVRVDEAVAVARERDGEPPLAVRTGPRLLDDVGAVVGSGHFDAEDRPAVNGLEAGPSRRRERVATARGETASVRGREKKEGFSDGSAALLGGDDVVDAGDHRRGLGGALDGLALDVGRIDDAVVERIVDRDLLAAGDQAGTPR